MNNFQATENGAEVGEAPVRIPLGSLFFLGAFPSVTRMNTGFAGVC
jgi:hypothetical protein